VSRLLKAAAYHAKHGLPVFPVWPVIEYQPGKYVCACNKGLRCDQRPGKHPMGMFAPHGCLDATTDPNKIKHWWTCRPDANIGIAGGVHVMLDEDVDKGGPNSLAELQKANGNLPPTWRARSGSGGRHYYFRAPAGVALKNTVSTIGQGLDVRTAGGYVVAPPSNHISGGTYAWECWPHRTPLADLPKWLTEITVASKAARSPEAWRQLVSTGPLNGMRNPTVTSLIGHLLQRRVDPIVALELVLSWNRDRGRPPLPEAEVQDIAERIAGKELQKRRGAVR
jgi:hypothetical protein